MSAARTWVGRAVLTASILANVALAYAVLDGAHRADDQASEVKHRGESLVLLTDLTADCMTGMERSEVESRVRAQHPQAITKWEGDVFWVDEVGFRFADGRVTEVVLMNPPLDGAR